MGGSMARGLRALNAPPHVVGFSLDPADGRLALECGAIDELATDSAEAARGRDLVVYATPLGVTLDFLGQHSAVWGEAAITAVVDRFIDELSNDDMLNDNPAIRAARDSVDPDELKAEVTALVCQATGGPQEYTGRTMAESHAHMNISGSEWDQMITIFVSLLDEFSVPEAEQGELLPIVESTKADIVLRPDQ